MNNTQSKNPLKLIGCAGMGIFFLAMVLWGVGIYNKLVKLDEGVEEAWGRLKINISVATI